MKRDWGSQLFHPQPQLWKKKISICIYRHNLFSKYKLMFSNATFNVHLMYYMFCAAEDHKAFFFSLFSLVLGLNTLTSWGLGFLHGICMTGWVNLTHLSHSLSLNRFFFFPVISVLCLIRASPLCLCLCSLYAIVFVFVSCVFRLYLFCPLAPQPLISLFHTFPSFPLSCPLWIKMF